MSPQDKPPSQSPASERPTPMRQKVQVGRAEQQARTTTLGKALRRSLAKTADALFGLQVAVVGYSPDRCAGDALEGAFSDGDLLMVLDGAAGRRGAATFDPDLVGALIQQQTMGKVLKQPEGAARPQTATDAAVSGPFLEAFLSGAAKLPDAAEERQLLEGYAFGAWMPDARVLGMALTAPQYEILKITIDIAGGMRNGVITLCLPVVEDGNAAPTSPLDPQTHTAPVPPRLTLSDTLMNVSAALRIHLSCVPLSVGQLGRLAVGEVFALPFADFDAVEVQTPAGKTVARGVLGQADGWRAVQVLSNSAAPPKFQHGANRHTDPGGFVAEGAADLDDLSIDASPGLGGGDAPGVIDVSSPPADAPDLPDLSDLPDPPDLPDLPDLPELDDLPPLPQVGAG